MYFDKDGLIQKYVVKGSKAQQTYTPNTSAATGTGKPKIGGSYTLVDTEGKVFSSDALLGKYALVNFGYASCPDVCIEGLTMMADAYEQMPPAVQNNLNMVFITIDPERDTPAKLAKYLPAFDENIIGLTGASEQIADVAAKFLVYRAKRAEDIDNPNYLMNHSSFFYLMAPDGEYAMHYRHNVGAGEMAKQIMGVMGEHS